MKENIWKFIIHIHIHTHMYTYMYRVMKNHRWLPPIKGKILQIQKHRFQSSRTFSLGHCHSCSIISDDIKQTKRTILKRYTCILHTYIDWYFGVCTTSITNILLPSRHSFKFKIQIQKGFIETHTYIQQPYTTSFIKPILFNHACYII